MEEKDSKQTEKAENRAEKETYVLACEATM